MGKIFHYFQAKRITIIFTKILCICCLLASCGGGMSRKSVKKLQESGDLMMIGEGLKQSGNAVFKNYDRSRDVKWSGGAVAALDLSGVAFDDSRTATLISPSHVLMAAHHMRQPGEVVIFHDRSGKRQEAKIAAVKLGPAGTDIAVGKLDRQMPISPYKVLPPAPDYHQRLNLEPVVVTNQHGHVFIHTIRQIGNGMVVLGPLQDMNSGLAGRLVSGDSGNPSFLYQDGTMILVEIHHFGGFGSGPFVSDANHFATINQLMKELGGGYQLEVKAYRK